MGTTQKDIRSWFERGQRVEATHMIVVCDEFSNEDYPVYVFPDKNTLEAEREKYNNKNMQKVMEIYNLSMDKKAQLEEGGE